MHPGSHGIPRRPSVARGGTVAAPAAHAVLRAAVLVLILPLASVVLWSTPAAAHTQLLGSDPAEGATLGEAPSGVTLRFNEPVEAEFDPVKVLDSRGERVDAGDARVSPEDARVVEVGLEGLPEGAYTTEWRVTSVDGHVVDGNFGFEVAAGAPSAGEEPAGSAGDAPSASEGGAVSGESPGDDATPVVAYAAASLGVVAVAVLAVLGVGALRRRGGSGSEPGR